MVTRLPNEKILIVRLVALGDLATTSTLLNRIRAERPQARVTWVVGKGGASLVRLFSGVDEVIAVDERKLMRGNLLERATEMVGLWRRLLGKRFSLAIVAHADRRYRWVIPMVPASRIRMYGPQADGSTSPILGRFIGDEAARLMDDPGAPSNPGVSYEIADVRGPVASVELPAEVDRLVGSWPVDVVIVPGGARNLLRDDPLRRWPPDRYVEVARQLIAEGHRVAIIGDASDEWVRDQFSGVPVIDLIGKLDLLQTLKLLTRSRVLLAHDTGPLHFARLVRTPIVALFGPTIPRQAIGYSPDVTALWGGEHLACRPCYNGRDYAPCARNLCMEDLTVDRVLAAVRGRLSSPRTAAATA